MDKQFVSPLCLPQRTLTSLVVEVDTFVWVLEHKTCPLDCSTTIPCHVTLNRRFLSVPSSLLQKHFSAKVCVCVFSSHSFWTSSSFDVPAGVTQEEGHTGFLIHLLSAVRALIFLARRIQPFVSFVDREVEFCVLTI